MMLRLALTTDALYAESYSQLLEPLAAVVSIYEVDPDPNAGLGQQPDDWATDVMMSGVCIVEALFDVPPSTDDLTSILAEAAASLGQPLPPFSWGEVEEEDWVSLSQSMNPAIRAGKVLVRPSYVEDPPPAPIVLNLDAGRAFGSGSHDTTYGCLIALQNLSITPSKVVDIGTGSGLLAIAAARLWRDAEIIGTEIDARALEVAADNCAKNGVRPRLVVADGWRHPALREGERFDLIIENLLYRPLLRFSRPTVERLAPGGRLIVAGLLRPQALPLMQAYRRLGLVVEGRTRSSEWPCLILRKPSAALPFRGMRTI